MNDEGEFKKRLLTKSTEIGDLQESVVRTSDLDDILASAKEDFPKKEATKILGSDGEEHTYETYDTEAVEMWFLQWFGK